MLPTSIDAVPPAPREPSPRARALIFQLRAGQGAMVLTGSIFALVGCLFATIFCWGLPGDLAIALDGKVVQGELISQELNRSEKINGVHPTVLRFSYRIDGERYQAESSTIGVVPRADPDGELRIEVARSFPTVARVQGTHRGWAGFGGLLSLIFPAVGFFLVYRGATGHRRQIRAFTNGAPVLAEVTQTGLDPSLRINGRNPWRVCWEFLVDGRPHRGSLSSMSKLAIEDLLQAKQLVVLYDPEDPRANTVYVDDAPPTVGPGAGSSGQAN